MEFIYKRPRCTQINALATIFLFSPRDSVLALDDNARGAQFSIFTLGVLARDRVRQLCAAYERKLSLVCTSYSYRIEVYSSITKLHAQVHSINLKCVRELPINEFDTIATRQLVMTTYTRIQKFGD